jgi:hypothetical protein
VTLYSPEVIEFPDDEFLDKLRVFEGPDRRVLREALNGFASDLMQMLYLLNIAGCELRERMQTSEIIKGNVILHLNSLTRGQNVLSVFH